MESFDDTDDSVTYSTSTNLTWGQAQVTAEFPDFAYNGSWRYCNGGGCQATISFTGTNISVYADSNPNHGRFYCNIAINSSAPPELPWKWYNGSILGPIRSNRTCCSVTGLPLGNHVLTYGTSDNDTEYRDLDWYTVGTESPQLGELKWMSSFRTVDPPEYLSNTTLPDEGMSGNGGNGGGADDEPASGSDTSGSGSSSDPSDSSNIAVGVGVGLGCGLGLILLILLFRWLWRRRKRQIFMEKKNTFMEEADAPEGQPRRVSTLHFSRPRPSSEWGRTGGTEGYQDIDHSYQFDLPRPEKTASEQAPGSPTMRSHHNLSETLSDDAVGFARMPASSTWPRHADLPSSSWRRASEGGAWQGAGDLTVDENHAWQAPESFSRPGTGGGGSERAISFAPDSPRTPRSRAPSLGPAPAASPQLGLSIPLSRETSEPSIYNDNNSPTSPMSQHALHHHAGAHDNNLDDPGTFMPR